MDLTDFDKLLSALKRIKVRVPVIQIKQLKRLGEIFAEKEATAQREYKKFYRKASRYCSSYSDGIQSGDVTQKDFEELLRDVNYICAEIDVESDKAERRRTRDLPQRTAPSGSEGRPVDPDDYLSVLQEDSRLTINRYMKYKQMVPEILTTKFLPVKVPIVVITKPGLIREKLKALGLSDDNIFNYPILKKQLVVGMQSDWLIENYKRQIPAAVKDIVEILKERTGKKYVQQGNSTSRKQAVYVWLVTELDMQRLNRAAPGGHFTIMDWSFPFSPKKMNFKVKVDPADVAKDRDRSRGNR
jgi:hypothetical protein